MSLRESAARASESASLELAFYVPRGYALGAADPRNLTDAAGLHPALNLFPLVGNLADALSTLHVLETVPGAYEANPVMRPVVTAGAVPWLLLKAGVGVGMGLYADSLARRGRATQAKWIAALGGAIPTGLAIHNMRVAEAHG